MRYTTTMQYDTPYVAPVLTVDLVTFQLIDGHLSVLLLRRPNEPFQGSWALPGGYNPQGETTIDALSRIARQKTSLDLAASLKYVEQLYTFDTVARDPRGHAVSVVYMGCGTDIQYAVQADVQFFPVDALPDLAYDHANIVSYARKRLASKLSYTNAAFSLLPDLFTLTELQMAYEAVIGHAVDKRNFRKKILGQDMLQETGDIRSEGRHRPAKLYAFSGSGLTESTGEFGL